MFTLDKNTPLSVDLIQQYLNLNVTETARQEKLYKYYVGNHSILNRVLADSTKPNNRIVNPYAHYITDMMTGYFMGIPVKYQSSDEDLMNELSAIFNYNDESANNADIATDASIYGVGYELMFLDEDGQIRFKRIDPRGCIPIFENTIEGDLLYFIRTYEEINVLTNVATVYVDVYSRYDLKHYKYLTGSLAFLSEQEHQWGLVPINIYANNLNGLGDFETVISEIDAYDKLESDSLNEMEYTADCYLALYGLQGTEAEDISRMKEQRVLLLPENTSAQWLTKSINDTYLENEKSRLDENIHKFSFCPALTDKDFAGNASGVAMKYKLMGLENATAKKERAFKIGLQRRIEQICNLLSVLGTDYDYRAVSIIFTRNIPVNIVEMSEVLNKIGHLYSERTQMSLLPVEVDYEQEQELKQKEFESGYSIMDNDL